MLKRNSQGKGTHTHTQLLIQRVREQPGNEAYTYLHTQEFIQSEKGSRHGKGHTHTHIHTRIHAYNTETHKQRHKHRGTYLRSSSVLKKAVREMAHTHTHTQVLIQPA